MPEAPLTQRVAIEPPKVKPIDIGPVKVARLNASVSYAPWGARAGVVAPEKTLAQRESEDGFRAVLGLSVGLGLCFVAAPVGAAVLVYGVYKALQWLHKHLLAQARPELARAPMSRVYEAMGKSPMDVHRDKAIKRGVDSALSFALGVTACALGGPLGIVLGLALVGRSIWAARECRREIVMTSGAPTRARTSEPGWLEGVGAFLC